MFVFYFFIFIHYAVFCIFSRETVKNDRFIINADIFEGYNINEEENILRPYEKFSGNVKINSEQFSITSNFAKRETNDNDEVFSIYENVEIKKNSENLKINAGVVDFYTHKNLIYIKNNVNCQNDDIFFHTDKCKYDVNKNVLEYKEGGYFIKDKNKKDKKIIINSKLGYCNLNDNSVSLSEDIEIKNDDFTITCDKVNYTAKDNEIKCSENFKININNRKGEYITTKKDCIYNTKEEKAYVSEGVYHSKNQLIYGKNLIFDQKNNLIIVENGIELLMRNKMRFTCKKCVYNLKKKHGDLQGDTVIYKDDSSEKNYLYLYADHFTFDIVDNIDTSLDYTEDELDKFSFDQFEKEEIVNKSSTSQKENNQRKKNKRGISTLKNNKNETIHFIIKGVVDVCVCTDNFQCRSNEIHFYENIIYFPKDTLIWNDKNLMFGKNIKLRLSDNNIEKITINSEPFILMVDDLNFYNQVSGEKMIANIENNIIDKALFLNNVDTYYYLLSENKLTGVNRLKCSKFCAIFDDKNKLSKIFFDNQISGNFFFPDYIEKNKQKLVLDRFIEKSEFIKNTKQPDLKEIINRINKTSFIDKEDREHLFKE